MRVLMLSVAIVVADQVAKFFVIRGVPLGSSQPILGDLLRLTYVENPGMAFGIDLGGKLFFSLFSIAASVGIVYYLYRAKSEGLGFRLSLAMILGGAVGNLIDRVFYGVLFQQAPVFYGRVVDFVDVDFFDLSIFGYQMSRWPVFNLADACVTVGVILLLMMYRSPAAADSPASVSPTPSDPPSRADLP